MENKIRKVINVIYIGLYLIMYMMITSTENKIIYGFHGGILVLLIIAENCNLLNRSMKFNDKGSISLLSWDSIKMSYFISVVFNFYTFEGSGYLHYIVKFIAFLFLYHLTFARIILLTIRKYYLK